MTEINSNVNNAGFMKILSISGILRCGMKNKPQKAWGIKVFAKRKLP
jgi:hypothetical protein